MESLNELRDSVSQLKEMYDVQHARLRREMDWCDPFEVKDTDGHPYLASLLTALVNGQAAIVNAERKKES